MTNSRHAEIRRNAAVLMAAGALLRAEYAYASGDPSVIWWMGGALLLHLTGLFAILFSAAFRGIKAATGIVYVIAVPLSWAWAAGSEWNVSATGTILTLGPLLLVTVVFLATNYARRK